MDGKTRPGTGYVPGLTLYRDAACGKLAKNRCASIYWIGLAKETTCKEKLEMSF
jgi:hypothetical protein